MQSQNKLHITHRYKLINKTRLPGKPRFVYTIRKVVMEIRGGSEDEVASWAQSLGLPEVSETSDAAAKSLEEQEVMCSIRVTGWRAIDCVYL